MMAHTPIHLTFVMVASTLWLLALPPCSAFLLPSTCHRQSNFALHVSMSRGAFSDALDSADDDDNDDDDFMDDGNEDDERMPAAAQELRSFVTQRCIQSFMYLLSSTRDLHTVSWLDEIVKPITVNNYFKDDGINKGAGDTFHPSDKNLGSKLLNYHGLSAMNTTLFPAWDSFFTTLLEEPDTVLLIKTPENVGHRAYSEIDIDIEPARLCTRILSVREQLAREMTKDLKVISGMGQLIFTSYYKNSKERKDKKQSKGSGTDEDDVKSAVSTFDRPGAMYINFDPTDDDAFAPSPLRKGNFDLLYNLITQSAVIELLQSEDGVVVSEEDLLQNRASQIFLSRFYEERLVSHFVGSQWYGKGDDFIEELMLGSPILMARDEGTLGDSDEENDESHATSKPPLEVEPMRIAEQILQKRDKLALEWMDIMKDVPSHHTEIRKAQLDRLTGVPEKEPKVATVEDEFQ